MSRAAPEGRERPIIMTGTSVMAILAGRKTQTRWVLKPQPEQFAVDDIDTLCHVGLLHVEGDPWPRVTTVRVVTRQEVRFAVDQQLWVREGFAAERATGSHVIYRAGHEEERGRGPRVDLPWRSPIHMPRWASRLTLAVTDVRVERLQDISCADAIAEGIPAGANSATIDCDTPDPRGAYTDLWNSIHGPDAWSRNPWVAAIRFDHRSALSPSTGTAEGGGR